MHHLSLIKSQDEPLDSRRRRLLFRSWHRGTQEADLLLGTFAEQYLSGLDDSQLRRFEALLECTDADLFDWIVGYSAPLSEYGHDVMGFLKTFCAHRHVRPTQQGGITLPKER